MKINHTISKLNFFYPGAKDWMWNYCIPMGKFTDSYGNNYDLGFYISDYNTISAAIVYGDTPGHYISGDLRFNNPDEFEHYIELKKRIRVCFPELNAFMNTKEET